MSSKKKIRIRTFGGATLIADYDRVLIREASGSFPGSFTATWDMRTGLIRNEHYTSTVRADSVKMIDYV